MLYTASSALCKAFWMRCQMLLKIQRVKNKQRKKYAHFFLFNRNIYILVRAFITQMLTFVVQGLYNYLIHLSTLCRGIYGDYKYYGFIQFVVDSFIALMNNYSLIKLIYQTCFLHIWSSRVTRWVSLDFEHIVYYWNCLDTFD